MSHQLIGLDAILKMQFLILFYWLILFRPFSPQMNDKGPFWRQVNIGSGDGLVPSGTKPLPEPMLTHIYVATWRH